MPGETNRVSVQFEREATFNTIPGSPNMTTKEVVSESLTHNKTTTRSQRIRSDAQVPDWIETAVQATGGLNDELSYAAHDDFIEASMRGTYAATALSSVSGTSMTASTRRMTKTGANWNATGNIIAGQAVNISGFSTAANNGIKVVKTVTDDYVEFAEEETGLGDESGATVAVATAKRVINSTTARSYYIQKEQTDTAANSFQRFTGMRINSWNLNFAAGATIESNYDFMGSTMATSATDLDSTPTAASSNTVMSASANAGAVRLDGAKLSASSVQVQSVNLTVNNSMRGPSVIGQKGAGFINAGSFEVTGTLGIFYSRLSEVSDFVNHTSRRLHYNAQDAAGNAIFVTLPAFYFLSDGTPQAGGIDDDILVNFNIGCKLQAAVTGIPNSSTMCVSMVDA